MHIKSRLALAGHPIHPMLVNFPIALFVAGLVFDLVYVWQGDPFWYWLSFYDLSLGYLGTLAAAATGAVDFFLVIPNERRVHRPAAIHALLGLALLLLYGVNLAMRYGDGVRAGREFWVALALSAVGFVVLVAASWYGGELVFRYGVGVSHESAAEPFTPPRSALP